MQTIALNTDNNILLDNYGNISFKSDAEALAQDIANTLSLCRGENPYNVEEGINYDDEVLGKLGGMDYIEGQFRNRILENDEVISISRLDINYNYDNRQLEITSNINSIYGSVSL